MPVEGDGMYGARCMFRAKSMYSFSDCGGEWKAVLIKPGWLWIVPRNVCTVTTGKTKNAGRGF